MKKAFKVETVCIEVRVVADANASREEIIELAIPKISEEIMENPKDVVNHIEEDEGKPYGTEDGEEDGYMEESRDNMLRSMMAFLTSVSDSTKDNYLFSAVREAVDTIKVVYFKELPQGTREIEIYEENQPIADPMSFDEAFDILTQTISNIK